MRQWSIDAFTSRHFGGNQACVVEPLPDWPASAWMQALARENNAGATAFLVGAGAPGQFAIRWFTPWVEVPLCGHATLAAAHALFRETGFDGESLAFASPSGPLVVQRAGSAYEMRFPAQPAKRIAAPPDLSCALGADPLEVWAGPYLIALLDTPEELHALNPDLERLRSISLACFGQGNVGVAAVAEKGGRYDIVDRFFAPGYGLGEDAATGSFHCILAPIFAARLQKARLRFHQACPGRGAELTCTVEGDRVLLSGEAVTVAESTLRVSPEYQ
jgi:PhzF family phenazine biosynthesis protein